MRSKVRNAREHVALLRAALLSPSPEDVGGCIPALQEAAQCLDSVRQELHRGGHQHPELHADLSALQNELRLVSGLLEHGTAFYQGWASLLGAATAGYMPSGEAAPLSAPGAISVRG